jgi:hypothetical protein
VEESSNLRTELGLHAKYLAERCEPSREELFKVVDILLSRDRRDEAMDLPRPLVVSST